MVILSFFYKERRSFTQFGMELKDEYGSPNNAKKKKVPESGHFSAFLALRNVLFTGSEEKEVIVKS
jgi:hypothetical protein